MSIAVCLVVDDQGRVSSDVGRPRVNEDELGRAAAEKATDFFDRFHLGLLIAISPTLAYQEGLRIIAECRKADAEAFDAVPKGTLYYWLGVAAYLTHDFDGAALLMGNAAEEDLTYSRGAVQDTPAELFLTLKGDDTHQAAGRLVSQLEQGLSDLVQSYNVLAQGAFPPIAVEDVRASLLLPALQSGTGVNRTACATLLAYLAEYPERLAQLQSRALPASNGPFYLHLAKGCLLFETLLKCRPGADPRTKTTLRMLLKDLAEPLGLRGIATANATFGEVLLELAAAPSTLGSAVSLCARTRNTLMHSLEWQEPIAPEEYSRLYRLIGASCLHAIASLYEGA